MARSVAAPPPVTLPWSKAGSGTVPGSGARPVPTSAGSALTPAFYLVGVAAISLLVVLTLVRQTKDLSLTRTTLR